MVHFINNETQDLERCSSCLDGNFPLETVSRFFCKESVNFYMLQLGQHHKICQKKGPCGDCRLCVLKLRAGPHHRAILFWLHSNPWGVSVGLLVDVNVMPIYRTNFRQRSVKYCLISVKVTAELSVCLLRNRKRLLRIHPC